MKKPKNQININICQMIIRLKKLDIRIILLKKKKNSFEKKYHNYKKLRIINFIDYSVFSNFP